MKARNSFGFGQNLGSVLHSPVEARQVHAPDKSLATYVSFVGSFDHRTELDRNIKREDPRYNPALVIMAAKLSYESRSYIETVANQQWQVGVKASNVQMLPTGTRLMSWESYKEHMNSLEDSWRMTAHGLLEQINVTGDTS
ncbi:unnamed protein product [Linum tenue]|uniref:rRNA N-glycosidase n=1 Tax=Linum tenue TaxID=586396 RepID=A0AAV0LK49_9ROSI|nr:unnamed protein product [Linum tenue]